MGLTVEEIQRWNRDGYVVIRDVLADEDLAPLIRDYKAIVERLAAELFAAGRVSSTYSDLAFDERFAAICAEDPTISLGHLDEDLDIGQATARGELSEGTFNLLRNRKLMRLVEPILSSREVGWSPISHVRAKLPDAVRPGSNVAGWHQDAIFVTEDADDVFVLTVWFPITHSTVNMGCLELMPGVHKDATVYWGGNGGMGDSLPRDRPTVHEPMDPGDVILIHNLCPHGSGPNLSNKIRWSVDTRYMVVGKPSGRDCWPSFIAQSADDPLNETTYGEWQGKWSSALATWPKRRPRSSTPTGPWPYVGPTGYVGQHHAVPLEHLLRDGLRSGSAPPAVKLPPHSMRNLSRAKF